MPIPTGIASPALRGLEALWRKLRPEPAAVLARRAEVRTEIRERLPKAESGEVPEVLVVNYAKFDRYRELDERFVPRGASDWFKAEVKGLP